MHFYFAIKYMQHKCIVSDIERDHIGRSAFGSFVHLPKQFKLELTYLTGCRLVKKSQIGIPYMRWLQQKNTK